MKTHKVIDIVLNDSIGIYSGTLQECLTFKEEQGFGYMIAPMTKEEIELENKIEQPILYTEEDVKNILEDYGKALQPMLIKYFIEVTPTEWFEQNKKK